jgi:thioredoxin reductase (NADPH)
MRCKPPHEIRAKKEERMDTPERSRRLTASRAPVVFVADGDVQARDVVESALARRFGADYRVVTAGSAVDGLEALQRLARDSAEVAIVAADTHLPDMDAVEFLQRGHALHPRSSRVLLVPMDRYRTRLPFTELPTIQRATALGRIDFFIVKGWVTPEEWFFPQVQQALTAWTIAHRSRHLVYRVVGQQWAPRSHQLRDVLGRNGVPFEFSPADSTAGRRLIREHGIDESRLPAVILDDGSVLQDPSYAELATAHGIHAQPPGNEYDLAIVGAGPAGLAAAVYGASEGLSTIVIESLAIGGQAGTSSLVRNYLGFPRGISGGALAHEAWEQAVLFGAEFVFTQEATHLDVRDDVRELTLSGGDTVIARAVIVANGVAYRRLEIPSLDRLLGAGVFYGAAGIEAPALTGENVYVVGGANSAGQAALHLAKFAAQVTLLVRGGSLAAGMSDYLITQLRATPNVVVKLRTRIIDAHGEARLAALTLEDIETERREQVSTPGVFIMIGAQPHTEWILSALALDHHGFILTDRDLPPRTWPLARAPLPFETNVPGILAAGDVRSGSIKRVAAAVGEGSVAVGSVHQYLTTMAPIGAR